LSKEKLECFSFTGLLKERSSLEKLVTFLYGQLAGIVIDNKCTANKSHTAKTYLSEQHCSDLQSYGLTDSESVTINDVWKEVHHLSSNIIVALKNI